MDEEKISILISNFNKEKYLNECIQSCLNQKYKNLEIIIIDNNSTDNSLNIIQSYFNKVTYKQKKRVSSYSPANQIDILIEAYKISTGTILCLLDSDDFFFSEKIQTVKNIFIENTKLDILFDIPHTQDKNKIYPLKVKKKFNKYIWPTILPTSSISLRRSFFKDCLKLKLFDNYPILEIDFRLNFYAQNVIGNYQIIDKHLTFYRQVEDGIMSNIKKFSYSWWSKRLVAHYFVEDIYKKQKIYFKKSYDYYLIKMIVFLFKKIKII